MKKIRMKKMIAAIMVAVMIFSYLGISIAYDLSGFARAEGSDNSASETDGTSLGSGDLDEPSLEDGDSDFEDEVLLATIGTATSMDASRRSIKARRANGIGANVAQVLGISEVKVLGASFAEWEDPGFDGGYSHSNSADWWQKCLRVLDSKGMTPGTRFTMDDPIGTVCASMFCGLANGTYSDGQGTWSYYPNFPGGAVYNITTQIEENYINPYTTMVASGYVGSDNDNQSFVDGTLKDGDIIMFYNDGSFSDSQHIAVVASGGFVYDNGEGSARWRSMSDYMGWNRYMENHGWPGHPASAGPYYKVFRVKEDVDYDYSVTIQKSGRTDLSMDGIEYELVNYDGRAVATFILGEKGKVKKVVVNSKAGLKNAEQKTVDGEVAFSFTLLNRDSTNQFYLRESSVAGTGYLKHEVDSAHLKLNAGGLNRINVNSEAAWRQNQMTTGRITAYTRDGKPVLGTNVLRDLPRTNSSPGLIVVKKTSEGGDTSHLQGAEYAVYRSEQDAESDKNRVKGKVDGQVLDVIRIGRDGYGYLGNLTSGNYYVKEVKAPEGYQLDSNVYPANVKLPSNKFFYDDLDYSAVFDPTLYRPVRSGTKGLDATFIDYLSRGVGGGNYGGGLYEDAFYRARYPGLSKNLDKEKLLLSYLKEGASQGRLGQSLEKLYKQSTWCGKVTSKEQIVRGDLKLTKTDLNGTVMPGVKFRITNIDTKESYELETNEEGVMDTSESDLWFYTASKEQKQKGRGALEYGRYEVKELRCEANQGYQLAPPMQVAVRKQGEKYNVTDDQTKILNVRNVPNPSLHTTASSDETGTDLVPEDSVATLTDAVKYEGLKCGGETYTLLGRLMVKESDGTVRPLQMKKEDGSLQDVTARHVFQTKDAYEASVYEAEGEEIVTFAKVDMTGLGGKKLVVYEELFLGDYEGPYLEQASETDANSDEILQYDEMDEFSFPLRHENPDDEFQTLRVPDLHTRASSKEEKVFGGGTVELTDHIEYTNLNPEETYYIRTTLILKSTEEEIPIIVEGANEDGRLECKVEGSDGNFDIRCQADLGKCVSGDIVFYEVLEWKKGDEYIEVASHKDMNDEGQTVHVEEVPKEEETSTPVLDTSTNLKKEKETIKESTPVKTPEETVEVTESQKPNTGDQMDLFYWVLLVTVSALSACLLYKCKKKKE